MRIAAPARLQTPPADEQQLTNRTWRVGCEQGLFGRGIQRILRFKTRLALVFKQGPFYCGPIFRPRRQTYSLAR
jgi:hypothetical protein